MIRRVVCCLFIVAALLLLTSQDQKNSTNLSPGMVVAFAGETMQNPCACGQPGCVCPNQQSNTSSAALPSNQSNAPSVVVPGDPDLGPLVLTIFLAFIIGAKLLL
jgi:hypothetical protein